MIKAVWPCPESEIAKGRWKISKCLNEDIKANAEKIYLEVYGHPLHNADSPLYFAKMLYHEFIDGRHVTSPPKRQMLQFMTYARRQLLSQERSVV